MTTVVRNKITYKFPSGSPPEAWGPGTWLFTHSITLQNKVNASTEIRFYQLIEKNIPCILCQNSFGSFAQKIPMI